MPTKPLEPELTGEEIVALIVEQARNAEAAHEEAEREVKTAISDGSSYLKAAMMSAEAGIRFQVYKEMYQLVTRKSWS